MRSGDLTGYFNHFRLLGLRYSAVVTLKTQYITMGDNRKPIAVYQVWNPTLSATIPYCFANVSRPLFVTVPKRPLEVMSVVPDREVPLAVP